MNWTFKIVMIVMISLHYLEHKYYVGTNHDLKREVCP